MYNEEIRERFLRYVRIETTSKANCPDVPTTQCQFDLAYLLEREMRDIGLSDVFLDEKNCVVYGTIPSNIDHKTLSVGFVAHMDTSPDVSGKDVKPWVFENYDGSDVVLNSELNIVSAVKEFPNLLKYVNQDIVFTDGTTLLGADDKSAISELMVLAHHLINHPEIRHGKIAIAFTPDEEVGGLAENLDFERFGADIAYTVDGDYVGYYSDETCNAIEAQRSITGKNVHPVTAKGIMKNAVEIGCEFISMLPEKDRPQYTEGREGFYHPHVFSGNVEKAEVLTLIRDHDEEMFNQRRQFIIDCVEKLNRKYGENTVSLNFANGYFSMKKVVDKVPFMIEDLVEVIKSCGVEPYHLAFRGGTDGSSISQRGLPCPNISAGYENAHSRHEFVSIQAMVKTTEILLELCKRLSLR